MKNVFLLVLTIMLTTSAFAAAVETGTDSIEVINLNKQAFAVRLSDPGATLVNAQKALELAKKANYKYGIAEAYRIIGIGNFYLNQPDVAIDSYLKAIESFKELNDLAGQAKVYNNMGNLYRDSDYDKALQNFNKSLEIANQLADIQLVANLYQNIGNVYYNQKKFDQALDYYKKCNDLFVKLKDDVNLVWCTLNQGVVYYKLNYYIKAEHVLLKANKQAEKLNVNAFVTRTDLALADVYRAQNKMDKAEQFTTAAIRFQQ